jgi:flavodoxin
LKSKVRDIESYDVILIGFPIWGMALPSPITSFLSEHDLSGKTIVRFCTDESALLEGFAIEGKTASTAQSQVTKWLRQIELIEEPRVPN